MGPQDIRTFSNTTPPTMHSKLSFTLLGLVALVAAVQASVIKIEHPEAEGDFKANLVYANVYDGSNETGNQRTITSYIPDLGRAGMGNAISSSCSTGSTTRIPTIIYNKPKFLGCMVSNTVVT